MASSGNFCVMNSLVKGTENVSSGNCKLDMTTNNRGALGNFEIPLTGKWYFECFAQMGSAVEGYVGISDIETDLQSTRGGYADSNMYGFGFSQYSGSNFFSIKVTAGSADNAGRIDEGTTNNAVLGIAINRDDDEIKLYTNNTLRFTLSISATTSYYPFFGVGGANNSSYFMYLNAGQDSTFGGNKTAGGNADGNGFGDFFYSPPSGHLALSTANLPISDDIDPAQTDDDYPGKQFNTVLYTGNDGAQSVTGVGFKPDLVWIKARNSAQHYAMFDSSRGALKRIGSSRTNAEDTDSSFLSSFDTDGFSWSTGGDNTQNGSYNYVSWCWKANGGTTATNNDGSITSTVQANDKAGFSIITWTASGANGSIGHGLSAKPDWHIIKKRNDTSGWAVYHKSLGATKYYRLDTNSSASTFQYTYNNTEPDATKIYLGDNGLTNHPSGDTYVCYAWREVEGYSKFGTYTANGNSDGPFIYTGFRPRMLFIRRYSGTDSSFVIDTARETKNVNGDFLFWDSNQTESSSSLLDILSNGFKLRTTSASLNPSGTELIWGAWGDVPFKYNNTF